MATEVLFPYQQAGAEWLSMRKQALLGDDMGLGKSAQAVTACDRVGAQRILVACPASLKTNWAREFQKFSDRKLPIKVIDKATDEVPTEGVVIVSYDLATPTKQIGSSPRKTLHDSLKQAWDVVILDEAHYLKERTTLRTRSFYGHRKVAGIADAATFVWRLTGTPAPNDASELWTHLTHMGAVKSQYWDFTFRYCTGFESNFGFKVTGHRNVEELKGVMEPYFLRRKKEEVMKDLPPIVYQEMVVDRSKVDLDPVFYFRIKKLGSEGALLSEIQSQDQRLREALAQVNGTEVETLESLASSMATLRQYTAMAKLPSILDIIYEELESGAIEKIVLFGIHRTVIEEARVRLAKFGAVTLYGQTPLPKRQYNVDRFQTDKKTRVFIGNIQAAGTGITLTAAHEAAFLEMDWTPANNAQAAMRIHRIGQDKPVRVRMFSLAKSVDEAVTKALIRKTRELSKIF